MLAHCHIVMAIRSNIDVKRNLKVIAENGVKTKHFFFCLFVNDGRSVFIAKAGT